MHPDSMPEVPNPPTPDAAARARTQATAYKAAFRSTPMELKYPDGTVETIEIPPHPNLRMLDDPELEAYERLLFIADTEFERWPDLILPEQKLANGAVIPQETRRGALKSPLRRIVDGKPELVTPPWNVQICKAAIGDEKYNKIRAAGKSAADVWRIWNDQSLELAARQTADPFPAPSDRVLEGAQRGNSERPEPVPQPANS